MKKKPVMVQVEEPSCPLPRIGFTGEESAEILGIGRTTFYKLVKAGDIIGADIGGVHRYTLQELTNYALSQTQKLRDHKWELKNAG